MGKIFQILTQTTETSSTPPRVAIKLILTFGLRLSFASDSRRNGSLRSSKSRKMEKLLVVAICLTFMFPFTASAPQQAAKYSPYNYDYKVEDAEKKLFFDKAESQDATGKVRETSRLCLEAEKRKESLLGEGEGWRRDKWLKKCLHLIY